MPHVHYDVEQPSVAFDVTRKVAHDVEQPTIRVRAFEATAIALPTVNVGADQVVIYADGAFTLTATVDYGYPTASLLWTQTSGAGTATITSPTAATTTATADVCGDYVFRCTATNAIGSAYDELTVSVRICADVLHHWEVPDSSGSSLITLNGSRVSQINDRVGSAHLTQATAANQPTFSATGGPNSRGIVTQTDAINVQQMAAAVSVAAGNRVGSYFVARLPNRGSWIVACAARVTTGGNSVMGVGRYGTTGGVDYSSTMRFTGGVQQTMPATAPPAPDTNWHLFSMRPLATGALCRIDVTSINPAYTGNDTLVGFASVDWGSNTLANTFADIAFQALVTNPTDDKDTDIRAYIAARYAL